MGGIMSIFGEIREIYQETSSILKSVKQGIKKAPERWRKMESWAVEQWRYSWKSRLKDAKEAAHCILIIFCFYAVLLLCQFSGYWLARSNVALPIEGNIGWWLESLVNITLFFVGILVFLLGFIFFVASIYMIVDQYLCLSHPRVRRGRWHSFWIETWRRMRSVIWNSRIS